MALLLVVAPQAQAGTAKMPASLAAYAQLSPQSQVQVIVQKANLASAAEEVVRALDGEVVTQLSIINAFVARLRAADLEALADSPSVVRVTPDGPVESTADAVTNTATAVAPSAPPNYYRDTLGVSELSGLTGAGIGVAVIDSGVYASHKDFSIGKTRVVAAQAFNVTTSVVDKYGHGTHVAGIIGGDGGQSAGLYTGVAPGVNLVSLKIADDKGQAMESNVVAAMGWVLQNKDRYNIRVVNLSVNTSTAMSYKESPLDAACEILWFNGIVVVASAGNSGGSGSGTIQSAPANDPFIITVGATDENGDSFRANDTLAPFSASGLTTDGYSKPDLVAPGKSIYSTLSGPCSWAVLYPDRVQFGGSYFRLSGTSMAAPMVTGIVALLLEDEPNLTPDQVKYRLKATAPSSLRSAGTAIPYVSAAAAINGTTTASANTGLPVSTLLTTGENPVDSSVMWNSVMWNSVAWSSLMWN